MSNRTILLFKVCDYNTISITKNDTGVESQLLTVDNYLREIMKQSFKFWHEIYNDSLIKCPLV